MRDTQWPRFEAFVQDREDRPHRNAGSVHAPDGEMALLNARDVFVRRPACISLWVVPAEAILSKTMQELTNDPAWLDEPNEQGSTLETYYVFQKLGQRRSMTYVTHVGQVEAAGPKQALHIAMDSYDDSRVYVWWVCPERKVIKSNDEDIASMFAPADEKSYRMPQEYRVVSEMLEIRQAQSGKEEER